MATHASPLASAAFAAPRQIRAASRSGSASSLRRTVAPAGRSSLGSPGRVSLNALGADGEWVSIRDTIQEKLTNGLQPAVLVVSDDSGKHANHKGLHDGHAGVRSNESHFRVVVVADAFEGMNPVKRHRMVNAILQQEFDDGLHALQLSTKTPAEYAKANP